MDLLGGYGSDGSGSDSGEAAADAAPAAAVLSGTGAAASSSAPKKRRVDLSRLPVSRPLDLAAAAAPRESEEAPLRKMAEMEAARRSAGRSLLDSLPPPKVTLGSSEMGQLGGGGSGGVRLDLGDLRPKRERPTAPITDLLRPNGIVEDRAADRPAACRALGDSRPSSAQAAVV